MDQWVTSLNLCEAEQRSFWWKYGRDWLTAADKELANGQEDLTLRGTRARA